MNYVMCFEVVDAFIIPVAASTVFSSLDTFIRDPVAAVTKIVAEIPTVSTFFMAYVLMRALTNSAMDIARVVHMLHYSLVKVTSGRTPRSYIDSSADNHAERARPEEKMGLEQSLGTAIPLAYEPWRVDPRPETARVGPGARLLRDVATNAPLLWQEEMTDPGYVFIWLPDIQMEEDGDLSAAVAPANLECSVQSGGHLERRPSCKKAVDVIEDGTSDPSRVDVQLLADMLYAEINHRLGSYGCVITMNAVLDKLGIRATTPTRPESPVHPMMRRA
ncbi:hypothetical protein GGF42_001321 [Coemansia sp. RSA 2424]|nr:hypothetical protein GGF42_001321 [Coemansia sp. RSA 2424]